MEVIYESHLMTEEEHIGCSKIKVDPVFRNCFSYEVKKEGLPGLLDIAPASSSASDVHSKSECEKPFKNLQSP
ncbi:hypothetical protein QYM36_009626 [Artemia franciscana]|uniref:Uncharacterized protein n=1 Tax=Artemia franciscana TaxID=6661 RepID=A0AA88L281_ARTSF|nr:hypothetical protein QYM36_009626 [Artemia franciscana]